DETRIGAGIVPRLPVRLGVVVGEELDEFAPALTGGLLDPPGHAFVSVRSFPSRKCRVGDVAREDVLEAELALSAARRPDARRRGRRAPRRSAGGGSPPGRTGCPRRGRGSAGGPSRGAPRRRGAWSPTGRRRPSTTAGGGCS